MLSNLSQLCLSPPTNFLDYNRKEAASVTSVSGPMLSASTSLYSTESRKKAFLGCLIGRDRGKSFGYVPQKDQRSIKRELLSYYVLIGDLWETICYQVRVHTEVDIFPGKYNIALVPRKSRIYVVSKVTVSEKL